MTSAGPCKQFTHLLGAYADGGLEPSRVLEIDEHIATCETCRERVELDRAIRGSLKRTTAMVAPEGLRTRIAAAMMAERARGEKRDAADDVFGGKRGSMWGRLHGEGKSKSAMWRTAIPLASAAALAVMWGVASHGPIAHGSMESSLRAGLANDDLIHDLVAEHSHPLPPERTDPREVRALEQYVGVPLRTAGFEKRSGARFLGGRVLQVHHDRLAMLQFELGNGKDTRRASLFTYDPRKIRVNDEDLAPRAVGTAEVRVAQANGYSVAVTQHGGVAYALVSDLDEERSAQLAAFSDE
jgi:anti-sigma factor (TIGR02949 family)